MAHYRLYLLRPNDRIGRALDLDCPNDEVAIAVVAQHNHSHAMELWSGKRKVRYFPAPEGDGQVKMMGGERRDRSAELGELAKSVRDPITSDSDPQASAGYEAMAAHLDHQQADALQSEDERLGRRSKEA
ncbi:hypothetical protein KCP91_15415 [Microvirga sp. SRT01]|jgi:hypothetical protein|uniref:Uncharacterized protein n=1 Tax=Sphingomonas longa TaxID=2778730 RepID=A0ABS2DCH1_9SPHN|nr:MULTISPECIES: hypothetical protein [Alphaproteobacteria]MBM6577771.1 hypothetical protein [Sphingomonas sp. BT552]MBR7710813.1 hypothetical protein [Microvirga sp. SRT01]